ncbi:histidine phosphatase family protein [Paenibacillus radicis (ex Xue et al. 2023)]|uniref:Histidine phosphatase family protein n=1 Tax=Paenibacillus radicis (ex Xue et al. 2023) TaxID=2972489 RepID=A0ABT1YND4_9BACL|nr:histidine phosphatase family protein [Paenibacillus radicis (ex Xue et al. 2023)]MCR8633793.1 histidine phosphatase family protein [Paenibacillus radicis (ex Xue et al. 2023)]
MVEILVIRHGQSEADILKRCEGRADYSLTELGGEQVKQLSDWIYHNYKPDLIYSSTLKRAKETAEAISNKVQLPINLDEDLMELNNGVIAGMLIEEARIKYPFPVGGRKRHESIEGGETEIQFRARAENFISKLLAFLDQAKGLNTICIVSHGGMISMLFRSFLNLPYDAPVTIPTGDTGVHIWRYDNGKKTIVKTNSQEHLDEGSRI